MNRLKELREQNDIYQKDIARYLNMSQTGYSQYETETNDIPTQILKMLAKYYNTSIDYLLYLTDERKVYPKSIIEKNKTSL
jgi:transcriptional regulator with XRE-family HTH domain